MKKNDVGRTIILTFLIVVAFMSIVAIVFRPAAVSSISSFAPGPGRMFMFAPKTKATAKANSKATMSPLAGFEEPYESDESHDSGPYETMGPKPTRYGVNAPIPCDGFGTGTCFTRA